MSRFSHQINYNADFDHNDTYQNSTFLRDSQFENDVYEFNIDRTRNINLSLNNISEGDDADLRLYRDSNYNGILDNSDLEVTDPSLRTENHDDAINYRGEAGTYFARVNYYSSEGDDRIDYELDLGTDYTGSGSNTIAVKEDYGRSLYGYQAAIETGYIDNNNTSDIYAVSVVQGETIDVTLQGLSSDADLRVIQDDNDNNIVDVDEVYASSTYGGTTSDTITLDQAGDYFVEVYQYTGNTDYTLQFDQEFV